ncbi:hypothetical protein niasHT_028845 [Heterodera trifolii]|uniref:BTB domain-containing protein n=1 Tax=Heterodera trifolii TaxID=157864 RepID=A0ABD2KQQ7_9BILA
MSSSLSSVDGNFKERMKHLLSTGDKADVQFLLLSAHKVVLMSASDEFEKMFINEKDDASADIPVIDVPDVEAKVFKVMLNFIYLDELSELRGENAMAVLYAAKKYNISGLIDQCLQIPIQSMPNVFLAYAQARLFELEALRWADEKCRQNATECSAGKRRAALGPALFKIRFPLTALEAFGEEIVPSGVLSKDEVIGVYQFHCHPNFHGVLGQYPLKFPYKSRICDWNIGKGNRGTLAMQIEKLSEFMQEEVGSSRKSDVEVHIKGMPNKKWTNSIRTQTNPPGKLCWKEKWLGFYLENAATVKDENWCCNCSANFRIVSQKKGAEDFSKEFEGCFKPSSRLLGFENFITFTELMDPIKGFYDENGDKVTLAID